MDRGESGPPLDVFGLRHRSRPRGARFRSGTSRSLAATIHPAELASAATRSGRAGQIHRENLRFLFGGRTVATGGSADDVGSRPRGLVTMPVSLLAKSRQPGFGCASIPVWRGAPSDCSAALEHRMRQIGTTHRARGSGHLFLTNAGGLTLLSIARSVPVADCIETSTSANAIETQQAGRDV